MIEDGYFVSFFSDDEAKKREPRNIIVFKNGKVSFYINPKESEVDKEWLLNLKERLSKLENNKKQYEFEATLLERFWEFNGYTPSPSDFIEPDKYDGKYDSLMKKWGQMLRERRTKKYGSQRPYVISSIWLNESAKFLLVCDGKEFFVYGNSPMANSIRDSMENEKGAFYQLIKKPKEDFDPVYFWFTSSMNFADEAPPKRYSKKLLESLTEELAILKKESLE